MKRGPVVEEPGVTVGGIRGPENRLWMKRGPVVVESGVTVGGIRGPENRLWMKRGPVVEESGADRGRNLLPVMERVRICPW